MLRPIQWVMISLFFTSCASINSVSLTPIPTNRGQVISAAAEKVIFLGFNFDNDFVNSVTADLITQCPNGMVTGILTKDETIHYFLAHKRRVVATGYCNQAVAATKPMKRGQRRTSSESPAEDVL